LSLWHGNPSGWRASAARVGIALACVTWLSASVNGQRATGAPARPGAPTAPAPPGGGQVESDPIKCWWQTDRGAVRVGEPFSLALTCGVIETDAVRVAVDPARLDPAALEMTPFEVLDGMRHKDISAPPWRYFQYSYTLRLLGDGFFGRDVDIPALALPYRVQSSGQEAGQGRDQVYLLPVLPVRVLSQVPVTAGDIQDGLRETFADAEARAVRATSELAIGAMLLGIAAVLVGVSAVRAVKRSRIQQPAGAPLLAQHAVLGACEREAQRIRKEAAGGWTPELVGECLTVFRLSGAAALGDQIAQTPARLGERPREGQLAVRMRRWPAPALRPVSQERNAMARPRRSSPGMHAASEGGRSNRVLLSAPTTAAAMTARLGVEDQDIDPTTRETLEEIAAPLHVFGMAHYGRSGDLDRDALDSALERGLRGLDRLRSAARWRMRAAEALARTAAMVREARWAR
jgi:hypothetical protein